MKKFTKLLICSFLTLCFGMSASAQTSTDSATVTFQVDMNSVTSAFTTPEVNGSFNNWCGNCWAMSDSDGDNIWDVSGKVLKNTAHEFKFSADGWGIQESLFSGSSCTVTNFGYTNRVLNVSGDTTLGVVCWESCDPCGGAPSAYNVTFQVDMNGVSGFTTPEVNGTFNGWCGNCWAMSDADGDNVWDFTTLLAPGFYEYKFSADLWSIQESLDSNLSCVTTTIDTSLPSGYASNRSFNVVASDLTLDVVPWNGCASAVVPGCTDATANNYDSIATTDDGSCMYDVTFTVDLSCESFTPGYVAATGPSEGWSCGTYALTDGDANGVWEGTFSMPAGTFEYIYCADGWAQSEAAALLASGTASGDWSCTPVTDYFSFANRLITVGALTTVDTWGSCSPCINTTTYNVSTVGLSFSPDTVFCDLGDIINFTLPSNHNAVEIDLATFSSNGTTSNGGFNFGFGTTGSFTPANAQTYYYVCQPHATAGMYGVIIVNGGVVSVSGCTDPLATNYDPTATVDDGSCIAPVYGCTDPLATNYYAGASIDDGSCTYVPSTCTNPEPTNAYISELIHDRARVNWDNMNDANCMVNQYRIRYREVGSSSWSSKTMAGSGLCVFGLNTTSKKILGLTASTTYEYYMKAWYCGGGVSGWSAIQNFTTADECQGVINFAVTSPTTTKASFTWDTTAAYSFARIKLRPDTTGGVWTTAGGFGVFYPVLNKSKNGLTPGQTYRASARTWCNPTGGTYRSAGWTSPIFWTQPTSIRVEGGTAINNLDVYPNPSRDIFNVSFTSEDAQDLEVRIINVVGEVVYTESLGQFVGEYTKQVDLATYTKGVYFLEITTNNGVVNKKLILQ